MSWPRLRLLLIGLAVAMGIMIWWSTTASTPLPQPEQAARKTKPRRATKPSIPTAALRPQSEEERDQDPAEDTPANTVTCTVAGEAVLPERVRARLISMSGESDDFSLTQTGNSIVLEGVGQRGTVRLHMRGRPSVEVSWVDDRCDPIVLGQTATIRGHVRNAYLPSTRRVRVAGCGSRTLVDEDGSFEMQVRPEPCELVARRRDGPLVAVSESVFLSPEVGEIIEVEMALPAYRLAGVGFSWQLVDGGVEVVDVHPDTPASDEGLQAGDVILLVDNESTEDMNNGDLRRIVGGKPDTPVNLLVLRADEEVSLQFSRESLDHAIPVPEHHSRDRKGGKHPW